MRTAASSKNSKKNNSNEDRIKRKKIKSSKRRRDPSPSSYSSDSEEDSRSRRKKSRREPKKLEKRRKESKKSEKRKGRKKRSRRDASLSSTGSDSIRSCSTCRGRSSESDRPRSSIRPARQTDRKVKSSPRGRSKGRERERERVRRSRHRSRSCSIGSRSRSRSRSHSEKKFEDKSRWLQSVLEVTKSSEEMDERYFGRDSDRNKIIKPHDHFPSSRSNESFDTGSKRVEVEEFGNESCNTRIEDGTYMKGEGVISSKSSSRSDVGGNDSTGREFGFSKDPLVSKKSEEVANDGSNEADDLELILRQKALENFRKFRGGISTNKGSLDDQSAKTVAKTSESKPTSSLEHQKPIQGGGRLNEVRARSLANTLPQESIVNSPVEKNNGNASSRPVGNRVASRSSEGQNTLNQLKRVHESTNKMPSEHTLLAKVTHNRRTDAEPGSSNTRGAEVNIADGLASGTTCLPTENQNCKSNEPIAESTSGSQFEQKTFSRVHDGEMVQVSYKVYIPKKTPALARRQLQR